MAEIFLALQKGEQGFQKPVVLKRILPSLYGGGDVRRSYDRVIRLWRAGRIDLEGLITHRVRLEEINEAIHQMRTGEALRTCITV